MSTPVPAPRNLANDKKPVPTPRRLVPIKASSEATGDEFKTNETNTFSRRVRTLSNTSKQIAEDIGGIVQEGKKAVIESTRQSVRKITRRFTNSSGTTNLDVAKTKESQIPLAEVDVFNTIRFNSPINTLDATIYNNVNPESVGSQESLNLPPPNYPPPPLRQESVYDEPLSLKSGSTNSSGDNFLLTKNPYDYESVFPAYAYNSDSSSCVDMTAGTIDKNVTISRSGSWAFYDSVTKQEENIYNNIDSTPVLEAIKSVDNASKSNTSINDDESADLNSNLSGESSKSTRQRENSLYENHEIELRLSSAQPVNRVADSVILQFDPLNTRRDTNYMDGRNLDHLKELEQILQGDLYNDVSQAGTYDNWSISNDSEPEEYMNPPTPPTRYDSLPGENSAPQTPKEDNKSKSNWFTEDHPPLLPAKPANFANIKSATSESKRISLFQQVNKQVNVLLKKTPEIVSRIKNKDDLLQRPALVPKGPVNHKGMLYKVTRGPVEDLFGEFSARWCVLGGNSLSCFADNTCDNTKEFFPMQNIVSIQMLADHKYKYRHEDEDLHCLEINTSGKGRGGYVYGSRTIMEIRIWLQRIAECLTNRFSSQILSDFAKLGWAYTREGVSGQWQGAWVVLSKRTLYYAIDNCTVKSLDLRKARCIGLQTPMDNDGTPKTTDKGPNMLVDCPNVALYMRMWTSRETKVWCHVIKLAGHNNGPKLEEQQLTKNDVPVLVEKCINFIYAFGSMTEGIYRRAGSGSSVNEILTLFRKDAWAVQLTVDKFSEHDVATALKRFFRDLPEPLFTNNKRQYLYQVSKVNSQPERIRMYKAAIDQFSPVTQNTIRKLLSHLHFIKTQSSKNLMNVDNLASVWGPTLMHYEDNDDPQQDSVVVAQLISLYPSIFPENAKESEQEKLMLQVLERYAKSSQGGVNTKTTGDFRVWVYLHNKDGETYNIAVGPKKTAYEICSELSPKIKLPVHELQLEELVLNDSLTRPIHHTEKVLDVVLKWGYWDDADRKDNCLVLTRIAKYWEYIQDKTVLPVMGELKFADSKSKSLKTFTFEFSQAKLSYFKDKNCNNKIGTWNIEDISWYIGHEPKRNPQSRWTITFFPKKEIPKRTKQTPYFGNILVWNDPAQKAKWLAAMYRAEYPNNLTPPPQHVNLMSS